MDPNTHIKGGNMSPFHVLKNTIKKKINKNKNK